MTLVLSHKIKNKHIAFTDHLVDRKVNHWDPAIRELTSKTLYKLTAREPEYMAKDILPKLFSKTSSIDINERHGTVLAIGEIIAKLKVLENENKRQTIFISDSLTEKLNGLVLEFQQRDQFRGLVSFLFELDVNCCVKFIPNFLSIDFSLGISGEMMFQCCCDFIRNCSASKIKVSPECIGN